MTPKIEWCNWVFDYTDNMDKNKWLVKPIIDDHIRNIEKWRKELDEVLASKVDTSRRKIYKWWKKNK